MINDTELHRRLNFLLRRCKTDEDRIRTVIDAIDAEIAIRIYMETGEKPMSTDIRLGVSFEEIIEESGVDRQKVLDILPALMGEQKGAILRLPNGKYAGV